MAELVAWYSRIDARAVRGSIAKRASRLRWIDVPDTKLTGHSHAIIAIPMIRLMTCSAGTGRVIGSKVFVRKSKKIFGQKKPSIAAAI
jgi:hypothetical protein